MRKIMEKNMYKDVMIILSVGGNPDVSRHSVLRDAWL